MEQSRKSLALPGFPAADLGHHKTCKRRLRLLNLMLRSASAWERIGKRWFPTFAGVLMGEGDKADLRQGGRGAGAAASCAPQRRSALNSG
jgi:hypothetical protein